MNITNIGQRRCRHMSLVKMPFSATVNYNIVGFKKLYQIYEINWDNDHKPMVNYIKDRTKRLGFCYNCPFVFLLRD